MIDRIRNIIDPSKIEIIVSNHVEMDHSGSLPHLIGRIGNPTVITSERGKKGLEKHYQRSMNFKTVKTGDTLPLVIEHSPLLRLRCFTGQIACSPMSRRIGSYYPMTLLASISRPPRDLRTK
jgi:hypothetical protein